MEIRRSKLNYWTGRLFLATALLSATATLLPASDLVPDFVPGSWTMVILPDTQNYTNPDLDTGLQTYGQITQWIADNKESRNIRFVMHVGDITAGNTAANWQVASNAMATLDNAGIAYSMTTGNHDCDQWATPTTKIHSPGRDTLLNNYFSVSRYQSMSTFGGTFEDGRTENNYHLFSANGIDYITISMEWGPRDEVVAWADNLLTQYSNRNALITTHAYTYTDGTRYDWATYGTDQIYNPHCSSYAFSAPHNGTENVNDGEEIWNKLVSKHANVEMVFSGHVPWSGAYQAAVGDNGNTVYEMVSAYHTPLEGWIRLLEFNPDNQTVQVKTYSPSLGVYLLVPDQQFSLSVDPIPEPSCAALLITGGSCVCGMRWLLRGRERGSCIRKMRLFRRRR